jgi:hypothetical protein
MATAGRDAGAALLRGRCGEQWYASRCVRRDADGAVTKAALFVTDWTAGGARCATFDMVDALDPLARDVARCV